MDEAFLCACVCMNLKLVDLFFFFETGEAGRILLIENTACDSA